MSEASPFFLAESTVTPGRKAFVAELVPYPKVDWTPGKGHGRPPELTPEVAGAIVEYVRLGAPFDTAAQKAGVRKGTARSWLRRGRGREKHRKAEAIYIAFAANVARARAEDQVRRIARIEQAGRGGAVIVRREIRRPDGTVVLEEKRSAPSWKADAWMLERTDPAHFGRKDERKEVTEERKTVHVVVRRLGVGASMDDL